MEKRIIALAAAGAVALCIAAVVGSGQSEPDLAPIRTVEGPTDIVLPLEAFHPSADEWREISSATLLLERQCAARFGVSSTEPPVETPDDWTGARYGIVDLDAVAARGYRPAEPDAADAGPVDWLPSEREHIVMVGADLNGRIVAEDRRPRSKEGELLPVGGCKLEASRQFSFSFGPYLSLLERLESETFDQAEQDSRTQAAWDSWTSCMRAQGFTYRSPWEPNDADWTGRPDAEKETAKHDLACRHQVKLLDIWLAAETAYQERAIAQHSDELATWRHAVDDHVIRATQIIAGH